jgi:hypothetical protein
MTEPPHTPRDDEETAEGHGVYGTTRGDSRMDEEPSGEEGAEGAAVVDTGGEAAS